MEAEKIDSNLLWLAMTTALASGDEEAFVALCLLVKARHERQWREHVMEATAMKLPEFPVIQMRRMNHAD